MVPQPSCSDSPSDGVPCRSGHSAGQSGDPRTGRGTGCQDRLPPAEHRRPGIVGPCQIHPFVVPRQGIGKPGKRRHRKGAPAVGPKIKVIALSRSFIPGRGLCCPVFAPPLSPSASYPLRCGFPAGLPPCLSRARETVGVLEANNSAPLQADGP